MRHVLLLSLLCICLACATDKHRAQSLTQASSEELTGGRNEAFGHSDSLVQASLNSFELQFHLKKIQDDTYTFSVDLSLDSGNYVISPSSEDSVYGPFDISIEDNQVITMNSFLEIPASVEEMDPILEKPIKFIRVDTRFQHELKVFSSQDFVLSGSVWFVLEPSCIPFNTSFVISQQAGHLEVKKAETVTDYPEPTN